MADLREAILARLAVVIAGISGIESAARNLDQQSETKLPAIVLYDGREEAMENAKPGRSANLISMFPIFTLSVGDVPENIGTVANGWRAKLIKALLLDETIAALCGTNGGIYYLDFDPSLTQGRTSQLEIVFNFKVNYPLIPTQL